MYIKRGDVVLINLEPIIGAEQGKTRPALIIQNDLGNKYSPLTIIAPITSKKYTKNFPTNVIIYPEDSDLEKESTILFNQIRCVDKSRIIKKLGKVKSRMMTNVDLAIKKSLDLY